MLTLRNSRHGEQPSTLKNLAAADVRGTMTTAVPSSLVEMETSSAGRSASSPSASGSVSPALTRRSCAVAAFPPVTFSVRKHPKRCCESQNEPSLQRLGHLKCTNHQHDAILYHISRCCLFSIFDIIALERHCRGIALVSEISLRSFFASTSLLP